MTHFVLPGSLEVSGGVVTAGVHVGAHEWDIKGIRYVSGEVAGFGDKAATVGEFLGLIYDNSTGSLTHGDFKVFENKQEKILSSLQNMQAALESYGYKLVTWGQFKVAKDRPDGLLKRALDNSKEEDRKFAIYDPENDDEGWMLIGANAEDIARETVEDLIGMEPIEGPLHPFALKEPVL